MILLFVVSSFISSYNIKTYCIFIFHLFVVLLISYFFLLLVHSYKVVITIDEISQKTQGSFEIMAIDSNNLFTNMSSLLESGEEGVVEPGHNYTLSFYASSPKIIHVKEVKLKWTYWKSPSPFSLRPKKVNVKKLVITHIDPVNKG